MKRFFYILIVFALSARLFEASIDILVLFVMKMLNIDTTNGIHPLLGIGLFGVVGIIVFVGYCVLGVLLVPILEKRIHALSTVQKIERYMSTLSYPKKGAVIGALVSLISLFFLPKREPFFLGALLLYVLFGTCIVTALFILWGRMVKIFGKKVK